MNTLAFCSYFYHNLLFDLVYFHSVKLLLSNIICIFGSDLLLILGAAFHLVHLNVEYIFQICILNISAEHKSYLSEALSVPYR